MIRLLSASEEYAQGVTSVAASASISSPIATERKCVVISREYFMVRCDAPR
jgi:hypothetical protein